MVPVLARALELRFEKKMSRDAAVQAAQMINARGEIEAAWKWIDRNWRDRIAPLFQLEYPPSTAKPAKALKNKSAARFTPPWEAIRDAAARGRQGQDWITAPSIIQERNDLRRYTILQPGTYIWRRDALGIIDHTPYRTRIEVE
jgi:hypothetical protein